MSLEKAFSDPKFSMSRAGIEHVPLGPEASALTTELPVGPQGFGGSGEKWLFIFRELGSTCNYFRGAREQAHNFGNLGSLAKKQKKKKKKKIRKSLHFV